MKTSEIKVGQWVKRGHQIAVVTGIDGDVVCLHTEFATADDLTAADKPAADDLTAADKPATTPLSALPLDDFLSQAVTPPVTPPEKPA